MMEAYKLNMCLVSGGAQQVVTLGPAHQCTLKLKKKIKSWNALETSYSSLMPCLKYNVSFLSLTRMQWKWLKFNLGLEWPQCVVYVIFLSVSFEGYLLLFKNLPEITSSTKFPLISKKNIGTKCFPNFLKTL